MKKSMAVRIANFAEKPRSVFYRIISVIFGGCIFLFLMPIVFVWIGEIVTQWFSFACPRSIELICSGAFGITGLLILLWAIFTQWAIGRGGPMITVPTQKLITTGPYALCRNPIQLGDFLYVFAFGLIFGNLSVALVCTILQVIVGVAYHKGIEEKELLMRFGDEYRRYKEGTPFLIPRFRRNHYGV